MLSEEQKVNPFSRKWYFFLEFLWIWKVWIIKQEQPGVAIPKCPILPFHKGVRMI